MDAQGNMEHSTQHAGVSASDLAQTGTSLESAGSRTGDLRPVDMHVHIVGNGLRGSGCWMKIGLAHRPLAAFMLRHIGVGVSTRAMEFDEAYVNHLAKLVRESSLGAAVILAQDEVYDASGRKLDFGSFYVPNDYVLKLARQHREFLPAVSIHPARADALDELERCLAAGA